MKLILPAVFAVDEMRAGNRIRQIAEPATGVDGTIVGFTRDRIEGFLFTATTDGIETLIIAKSKTIPPSIPRAVVAAVDLNAANADLSTARWLQHPVLTAMAGRPFDYGKTLDDIRMSWIGAFSYAQEEPAHNRKGLRLPQIGAIHAIHAHWTVSQEPATIVMPTGTGKTEAMLSILVSAQCPKVLVLVPTDALRTQIADKFLTLGVLKEPDFQLVDERARRPIVGVLQHIPNDVAEVDDVFDRCNVVVTTSSIAGQCGAAVQERMAAHCSHLFIDEAHHAEAPTWSAFKRTFKDRKVLQFTATPFREDGQPLDGKIIFTYPLRKAQEEEYFKPIRFRRVVEFDQRRADEAIAKAAIEQLRADAAKGHILMARTENVERAKQVFKIYERYPEFKPVQLHTGIKSVKRRAEIRRQIIEKESRIVVCVDMLGEGFDLPELKIAAFHDIRKTLAVTLQLAGVKMVTTRPASMPIGVDWPEEVYTQPEAVFSLIVDGTAWPITELDIGLDTPSVDGPLRFTIASETEEVIFDLELFGTAEAPDYRFVKQGDRTVEVAHAGRVRPAAEFFFYNPPVFWFADGSSLTGNQYATLRNALPQYDSAKIGTLDWHGINLRNESQGPQKDASSIQARVITDLKLKNFSVLFDDDGKGEAADIVAIRSVNEDAEPFAIEVELYHCKFSHGDAPGRRVEDLYQLCGQAQKSIAWASSSDKKTDLFTHLLRRESSRTQRNQASRLEVGTTEDLLTLRDMSRLLPVTVKIFIVQPGLRKQNPSPEQLGLLSVTENYLWETYQLPLRVIASE